METSELCKELASGDQTRMYRAKLELTNKATAAGANGKEAEKAQLAKELADYLKAAKPEKDNRGEPTEQSIKTVAACREVCNVLALVAGPAEVPVLKDCLKHIDLRELARCCLNQLGCQEAVDALVDAIKTCSGTEFRCGIVNSLGRKSGSSVIAALRECIDEKDNMLRLAAAEALADQPDVAYDQIISSIALTGRGAVRVTRARLRLGHTLLRAGQKPQAKQVFQSVAASKCLDFQKRAAEAGILLC